MDTLDGKRKKLLDRIGELPEDWQYAIGWLIEHRVYAAKLCRVKPLTQEERSMYMDCAIQSDNTMMMVLLLFEKRVNVDGTGFQDDEEKRPQKHRLSFRERNE